MLPLARRGFMHFPGTRLLRRLARPGPALLQHTAPICGLGRFAANLSSRPRRRAPAKGVQQAIKTNARIIELAQDGGAADILAFFGETGSQWDATNITTALSRIARDGRALNRTRKDKIFRDLQVACSPCKQWPSC